MSAVESTISVAVVGFGKLGLLHAGLMSGLEGARLNAVVDDSAMVLSVLKDRIRGLRTFKSHRELLASGGIDAAVIATPTHLHVPIAIDFVEAGIPVFIEKPLAVSAEQARPLVDLARARGVVTMVGYMGRYLDTFVQARKVVASGALGELQMLRCSMYVGQLFGPGKGWRYDPETAGGGVLITQNSHLVDKLRWMFGEIEWVSAQVSSLYSNRVEDHAHAYFRFKSGLSGFMDASWSARHFRAPTIAIHVQGRNGSLDVDDDSVSLYLDRAVGGYAEAWTRWRKPDLYEGVSFDIGGPQYTRQAEAFLNAVRCREPVSCDADSGYRTQCVIDALYRSARARGAPITLESLGAGSSL